jgi:Protein kinase domain
VASSSLSSDFRIKQTVPKVPVGEQPRRRPASGRFGTYELVEEIGRGGMGVVYSARDESGCLIALKVMREADDLAPAAARFRREAEVVAQVRHPNIVPIHHLGEHGNQIFLVMDYIPAGTLGEHLKRFLADSSLTVRTLIKIARAVHHAHHLGVLHRDLKPSNVLLDDHDEPKVTDFGLAKLPSAAPELSRDGELIGTPAYMSPEQAGGRNEEIGPATDVWGLGVILYELVTGLRPFPGGDQARMLYAIQTARPLPPRQIRPRLDPALEAIILRCLEKKPARRYPSAAALADDLERWQRGEPIPSRYSSAWANARAVRTLGLVMAVAALSLPWAAIRKEASPAQATAKVIWSTSQRGAKVELLGNGVLPTWYRWPLGPCQTIGSHPLSMSTYSPCLLELVPSIPTGRYRMRVEAQDYSFDLGATGLYFAHQEHDNGKERDHFYCALLHTDTNRVRKLTLEVHRHRAFTRPDPGDFHSGVLFDYPLPPASNAIPQWHQFGIDTTEDQITLTWDGQRIGVVPWSSVTEMTDHLAMLNPPLSWKATPSPALAAGVFVRTGSTAFRHFCVETAE